MSKRDFGCIDSFVVQRQQELSKKRKNTAVIQPEADLEFGRAKESPPWVCIRCRQTKVRCCPYPNSSSCRNCFLKGLICVPAPSYIKKRILNSSHNIIKLTGQRSYMYRRPVNYIEQLQRPEFLMERCPRS